MIVDTIPDPNWLGNPSLTNTTRGNDFWLTFMSNSIDTDLGLTIIAVSEDSVTIHVEINGSKIGKIEIPSGGGEGKLNIEPPSKAYVPVTDSEKRLNGRGVHVYSEDPQVPFSCYAYSEAGVAQVATRDASHVLPTHMLGREYFVQTFQTDTRATEFAVVVTEDNTDLTILPKVQTSTGKPANEPITETGLQKGTVYLVCSKSPSSVAEVDTIDLSGSTICATKPVAVFQGNEAVKIATGSVAPYSANHAFEQTLPIIRWGKEYYVGLTEHSQTNYYNILAAYDKTRVTISGLSSPLILDAGQTLEEAKQLFNGNKNVKISADKPILVNSYLSCGGENQEKAIIDGKQVTYNWGNSTSAMIPSWESRVKQMSFYTDTISNETSTGVGHMYVQVVARTADKSKFTLDGKAVPASAFAEIAGATSMSIANIELTEDSLHSLETTGEGFVGFVYTLTTEARAYQYTLGFAAQDFRDSLYIENDESVMSEKSYPLDRTDKGWYQRQRGEWVKSRLDTAMVCDSTKLLWRIESPSDTLFRVDSIHWIITANNETIATRDTILPKGELTHKWAHQFIIPQNIRDARRTHLDYHVRALLYRTTLLCKENLQIDTMQTMVRVHTIYNDTVWKIVCAGDEFEFFSDTTKTNPSERYRTKFYYEPTEETDTMPAYSRFQYPLGLTTITRYYTSVSGCDSVSTLKLYVCNSYHDTLDYNICEKELKGLNTQLGDFFYRDNKIDFAESFKSRTTDSKWKDEGNGKWYFEGTSRLTTTGYDPVALQPFFDHGIRYNGCDSTLMLRLYARETIKKEQEVSICASKYTWKDENGTTIEIINKSDDNTNTPKTYTHTIPYAAGDCDSVEYELKLMFIDGFLSTDTIRLCRNSVPVTPTHMGVAWDTFDPSKNETGIYIEGDKKTGFTGDGEGGGCTYDFQFFYWVDPLPEHRDTVVYCYEEGKTITHTWSGHSFFWAKEKGATSQTQQSSLTLDFPTLENGRLVYELSDTVRATVSGNCDDAYYQVVILMPKYDIYTEKHMADTAYFEWNSKILAGENANISAIENPDHLGIVVMQPTGTYPSSWQVSYDPELKQYYLLDSVYTKTIHNEAGVPQQCDSVISLSLRVGKVFRDTTYRWSKDTTDYSWRGKNLSLPHVTGPTEFLFYDSLKTTWPVAGLDSIYTLSVTVFPTYSFDTTVIVCQDSMGYLWPRHRLIDIADTGHYTLYDSLQTVPREFRHPRNDTVIEIVSCDSIWTLDLTVNTVYNADYTYIGDTRGLKSNDTLTFFTPKTLFIGKDFDYMAHGGKTAEELQAEVGADQVEIVEQDSLYAKQAASVAGCDSTSYLQINLCLLQEIFLVDTIGDNDSTWLFGGDITDDHTQAFVYGRDFNVDDNGDPIDYTSLDRTVRVKEFVDTLHTIEGCDSIVHMTLRIFPTYCFEETDTICGNNGDYIWHGKTRLNKLVGDNETGIVYVYDSLTTVLSDNKVDSVYTLILTIFPGELSYTTRPLCYNDTVLWHGIPLYYDADEPATEIVHYFKDTADECGREIYMTPIFNPAYGYATDPNLEDWIETIHLCQGDDFHWLDENGNEHTKNLRDPEGKQYTHIPTDRVGDFIIYDSLKTVGCKCDSIFTLRFRVDTTYRYFTEEHLCTGETFSWFVNGELHKTYTAQAVGEIFDTIKGETTLGCDSSYYLHLHVDSTYHITVDTTLCPSETSTFEWNGISYDAELTAAYQWDAPHEFYDTLRTNTTITGCDSIRYLHLTILPTKDSIWSDTICESESYLFFDSILTTSGTYVEAFPNQWGCMINYRFTLVVAQPTRYTVTTEPLCVDPEATNSYPLIYTYEGEFAPVLYHIYYDSVAKAAGFKDLRDLPISSTLSPDTLDIEVPHFKQQAYPTPGHYTATIGFENGVCKEDTLMRLPFSFTVNYPSWIIEQHHSDMIVLLSEDYNGGYSWTDYQWYEGDSLLAGETKPYLYIPTGLKVGTAYHVELRKEGEKEAFPTCPIIAISQPKQPDEPGPKMGYLAVTPTCVPLSNPQVNILSRNSGTYRVASAGGRLIYEGTFNPGTTPLMLPNIEGMYVVQLWSINTPEEPYRAVKVLVRQQCPNCDISSF